jgi:hypothetical protein
MSPVLHGPAQSLEKALLATTLNKDIQERPTKDELIHTHVLKGEIVKHADCAD